MLHNITTNLRKNKFIIVRDFLFFHFYLVYKRERVIKHMIDDNFINHLNKLNYKFNYFHENRNHFY
jgi:hypothetical protein